MAATLRMASLTKVRLDSQGYTSWGRYFGNVPGTHIYMLDCNKPSIDQAQERAILHSPARSRPVKEEACQSTLSSFGNM